MDATVREGHPTSRGFDGSRQTSEAPADATDHTQQRARSCLGPRVPHHMMSAPQELARTHPPMCQNLSKSNHASGSRRLSGAESLLIDTANATGRPCKRDTFAATVAYRIVLERMESTQFENRSNGALAQFENSLANNKASPANVSRYLASFATICNQA